MYTYIYIYIYVCVCLSIYLFTIIVSVHVCMYVYIYIYISSEEEPRDGAWPLETKVSPEALQISYGDLTTISPTVVLNSHLV